MLPQRLTAKATLLVTFDTNGVLSPGISQAPGTTQITLEAAGTYTVSFSVSGVQPNQMGLFLNGALVLGSVYGSGAGTQQNTTGHVILTAASHDVLTVRNHSSAAAVTLETLAGGTQQTVNASISIEKIG